jgi:hypothetical protein
VTLELWIFACNIRKKTSGIFFILKEIWKKKTHNILFLMLDTKFKSLLFVYSFVGQEQGVSILKDYYR